MCALKQQDVTLLSLLFVVCKNCQDLFKGWTQFTDLGTICSPWLKGSVNISLAKYWYQFNERCHLVAYLGQKSVYVCFSVSVSVGSWNTASWAMTTQTRFICTSSLLSLQFHHSNHCMHISICPCDHVCLCIKHVDVSDFAVSKWEGGQTAIACSRSLPELGK